jgi:hypothetical protein
LVKRNPDGRLKKSRQQTTSRANPRLAVQFHLLLSQHRSIFSVFFLERRQFGLNVLHGLCSFHLLASKRIHSRIDEERQYDNRQPKTISQIMRQGDQYVGYGLEYNQIPNVSDNFQIKSSSLYSVRFIRNYISIIHLSTNQIASLRGSYGDGSCSRNRSGYGRGSCN